MNFKVTKLKIKYSLNTARSMKARFVNIGVSVAKGKKKTYKQQTKKFFGYCNQNDSKCFCKITQISLSHFIFLQGVIFSSFKWDIVDALHQVIFNVHASKGTPCTSVIAVYAGDRLALICIFKLTTSRTITTIRVSA